MVETELIYALIGLITTIVGTLAGARYYKARFSKVVKLLVAIDRAWADDKFTDTEIKEIIDAALDVAGKKPISTNIGV